MARQSRWHLMMPERIGFMVMIVVFSLVCLPTLWYQYQSSKLANDQELRHIADSLASIEIKPDTIPTIQEKQKQKVKTKAKVKETTPPKPRLHLDEDIPSE